MIAARCLRSGILAIGTLEIPPGITSVIGPNGSGKTTFLRLCAGITVPEDGTLLLGGIAPREAEVGWVGEFPDRNLLFGTVADEVASSLRFRRAPCRETAERTAEILARVGITSLADRPVNELSGGEKVKVALAAALVHHPMVLALDECDSHFDDRTAREIDRVVRESGAQYIIRCTQQMEAAARSDSVMYLENGTVRYFGTPAEVFAVLDGTPFYPLSWRCRA